MAETEPGSVPGPAGTPTFERLLVPLLDSAFGFACSMTRNVADAEDTVQEAAMRAFRAFHTFEAGTNFKAWFYRILTNCCFARHRAARSRPEPVDLDEASELFLFQQSRAAGFHERSDDPARLLLGRISEQRVAQAIAEIPAEYGAVCALFFLEEYSYPEIADVLGIPAGTVRSRLHRGRRLLQKALWQLAEEDGIVTHKATKPVTQ